MQNATPISPLDKVQRSWRLTLILCATALAAVAATAALTQRSVNLLDEAREVETRALLVDNAMVDLKSQMLGAQAGQLSFLLTGRADHLQPYYAALTRLKDARAALELALSRNAAPTNRLDALDKAVATGLKEMERTVRLKSEGRSDEAIVLVMTDAGKQAIDAATETLRLLANGEDRRMLEWNAAHAHETRNNHRMLAGALAFDLLLLLALAQRMLRGAKQVRAARQSTQERIDELSKMLEAATEKNEQVHGLSELSRFLQSCVDMDEAVRLLKHELPLLMRAQGGALYLMEASRDQLRQAFSWGGDPYSECFEPSDCWAVRLGKPYRQPLQAGAACCAHLHSEHPRARSDVQCLPIVAHGELIGLLVLDTGLAHDQKANVEAERYRRVTLEEVGLSIGLLKLRESLRQQSIRDGLTGLFNRRFLEESTQREVLRASRVSAQGSNEGIALMMIDIDHFKRFNDLHGHEVGDHVLRSVAEVLQRHTRGSDVAARYGGEEFTLVLVDMPVKSAIERAEQVRADVEALVLHAFGKVLGPVTVSIGVAQFPADGNTVEALFLAADKALYAAKDAGRNRVALAADANLRLPRRPERIDGTGARILPESRVSRV